MASIEFRGKGLVYSHHLTIPTHAFVLNKTKSVGPTNATSNMIIQGNDLIALKSLQSRYANGFSLIYATPPYNNGIDNWKYNDDIPTPLTQEWLNSTPAKDDPDRHDKWLSWMLPRLRLMYELLSDDGLICVSIDDHEMHRLKCLMDEIFQEQNFLATLVWQKKYSTPPDVKDIGYVHECILVYRKRGAFHPFRLPATEEQLARYRNHDGDNRGPWKAMDYTCRYSKAERENLYYAITNPHTGKKIYPNKTRVWAYSKEEHKTNEEENRIWWGKDGKNKMPSLKNFLDEVQKGMVPASLLPYEDVGHTDEAAKELRSLIPDAKRDGKPARLIRHLMRLCCKENDAVLFPFGSAGEGPQAVLEANAFERFGEKLLSRKFVVIAQDDADKIVAERTRRLIKNGIKAGFGFYEIGASVDAEELLSGASLPGRQELARYIYSTSTGATLEDVISNKGSLIGQHQNIDIHLLYEPKAEYLRSSASMLDIRSAEAIAKGRKAGRKSVVFASGKYVPQRDLEALGIEFCHLPLQIYRLTRISK
ncbi:site-specific DNA-methyltransferase [Ferrovibrio terrae]|uniref:site-specific DNA-methyltransferase n=1 Tax=Ferrovibrio terrae TaxID=2594003 RepID=UPI003137A455